MKRLVMALAAFAAIGLAQAADGPCCGLVIATAGPTCRSRGYWNAPYSVQSYPICAPLFAGGEPLWPQPPLPETVIRLRPISSVPKEPPPTKPITREQPRPRRPRIDIDPPDTPPDMPKPTNGPRLHLLLLVDDELADLGRTHAAGADLMTQLFKSGITAACQGATARLGSADLTPETITRKLGELPIRPDDTLVALYAGPAVFDEPSSGFVLAPSKSPAKIPRDKLRQQLTERGARLTVFLTDPATNLAVLEPPGRPDAPTPAAGSLDKAFFATRGVVDLHANSPGEFAAPRGVFGGCFTLAFIREFGRPAGAWPDLLESVKFTTNNLFKSYRLEVLRADDQPAGLRTTFRSQESQIPVVLTPVENLMPVNGAAAPAFPPAGAALSAIGPGRLTVRLPAEARLWVDGVPVAGGAERTAECSGSVELRAEIGSWGGVYRVPVAPGGTTRIELQVPHVRGHR